MDFENSFDYFVFDLDGVIYAGEKAIGNSPRVLKTLRKNKKEIRFITNNPSRSPSEYAKKLRKLGIESHSSEFVTSPMATVSLIKEKLPSEKWNTVFIAGSDYLKNEVTQPGLVELYGEDSLDADLVVMGSHPRFNLEEIKTASIAIGNGAGFIGTNGDYFYPCEHGRAPATGALLASVEAASGKKALTAGKPQRYMFDLLEQSGVAPTKKTLLVGDSLRTDVAGGKKAGYSTALVLSGVTKKTDLGSNETTPDFILENVSFLLRSQ
ncbi:MAG: HAD-IIA family hydrolase [Candidatus Dadabacteria bacterium]|nr:HAD-IIA family hydrolase [Candidatus Dadabacteria bacterium]